MHLSKPLPRITFVEEDFQPGPEGLFVSNSGWFNAIQRVLGQTDYHELQYKNPLLQDELGPEGAEIRLGSHHCLEVWVADKMRVSYSTDPALSQQATPAVHPRCNQVPPVSAVR